MIYIYIIANFYLLCIPLNKICYFSKVLFAVLNIASETSEPAIQLLINQHLVEPFPKAVIAHVIY
jgi:hypothetical protein